MTKVRVGKWYSIGQAAAGVYGAGPNSSGPPSSITGCRGELSDHYHELREGGIVIDKQPCLTRENAIRELLTSPYHNPAYPDGSYEVWEYMKGPRHVFLTKFPKEIGNGDTISTDLYAAYWTALGARVGYRRGDTIVWDDGAIDAITVPDWYRG